MYPKNRPSWLIATHVELESLMISYRFGNSQPQTAADSAVQCGARRINPIKPLKNFATQIFGYTRALIEYRHHRYLVLPLRHYFNRTIIGRVGYGVFKIDF